VEQFLPLRDGLRRSCGDRVGMDRAKTRTSRGHTLSSCRIAPLKPKPGLNGPPVLKTRLQALSIVECLFVAATNSQSLESNCTDAHASKIQKPRRQEFKFMESPDNQPLPLRSHLSDFETTLSHLLRPQEARALLNFAA